jgi:hypothetical protein
MLKFITSLIKNAFFLESCSLSKKKEIIQERYFSGNVNNRKRRKKKTAPRDPGFGFNPSSGRALLYHVVGRHGRGSN